MATHLTRYPLDATADSGYSKKWTWSGWVKRGKLGAEQGIMGNKRNDNNVNSRFKLYFRSTDRLGWECKDSGGSDDSSFETNALFRDVNCWYHITFIYDSDNSTATERIKCYVNGLDVRTEYGGFSSDNQASSGFGTLWSSASANYLGTTGNSSGIAMQFEGCMSHCHLTYGYRYEASTFGSFDSTTGEWKINVNPSVTYGSQGYFLLKDDNSVTDQSGEGNNYTTTGTLTKTEDCPSNVFATWNPLLTHGAHGYSLTYSYGNNNILFNEPSTWTYVVSTLGASSGKYYFEAKLSTVGSEASIGVIASDTVNTNQTSGGLDDYLGKETDSIGYLNDGRTFKNNSAQQTGLTSLSAGSVVGVAMDLDNNTVQFYVNGSSTGNAVSLTANKIYHFGCSGYNSTKFETNFGNGYFADQTVSSAGTNASGIGIFEYNVPTGFTALSTKGLNE